MKALLQRVSSASVEVGGEIVARIGPGALVFLGVDADDCETTAQALADRLVQYRVFADAEGRMNLSLLDSGGELLVVSQFTLSADTRKGRRPGFSRAASPELAKQLYESFVERARSHSLSVETGIFAADMQVSLTNDGPVTFLLEN